MEWRIHVATLPSVVMYDSWAAYDDVAKTYVPGKTVDGFTIPFNCPRNEYLVFEDGPSEDVTLQWATYRDASDQCSLSRIWGGIHPPVDDIPGRIIGRRIGPEAFAYAEMYFMNQFQEIERPQESTALTPIRAYPNPIPGGTALQLEIPAGQRDARVTLYNMLGQAVRTVHGNNTVRSATFIETKGLSSGFYVLMVSSGRVFHKQKIMVTK